MKIISVCLIFFSTLVGAETATVIGVGRLGICLALLLERAGYEVVGVDLSEDYVRQLNEKTLLSPEPGVSAALQEAIRFRATTSLDKGLQHSDLYFVVLPTNPSTVKGDYDCVFLDHLLSEIGKKCLSNKHLVIVSTLFPGYIREVARPKLENCPGMLISYNPEFIAQGDIMNGLKRPDVVLIGEGSSEKGDELEAIHRKICTNEPYFARMSPESAEIMKLSLNCYVTMKISFANLIGEIAAKTPGADAEAILRAVGNDRRVGGKCLCSGYGFGGPCFPRDNRALGNYAEQIGLQPTLLRATDATNRFHAKFLANELLSADFGEYVFEDVCYKPNCPVPIIEESHKLLVAKMVAESGARVTIRDRAEIIEKVRSEYGALFHYETLR